jgi:hypothetical protein
VAQQSAVILGVYRIHGPEVNHQIDHQSLCLAGSLQQLPNPLRNWLGPPVAVGRQHMVPTRASLGKSWAPCFPDGAKTLGCRGSRAGSIPPLSARGRYLTVQLPQPPHPLLLLVPLLRYIINAVPAPSLYLNHSRSLFATHPKEVLVDSCHSLVSFFVFRRDRETKTRKPPPRPPPLSTLNPHIHRRPTALQ